MKVIYPGTFDPVTNGHLDIISRASGLFEAVIVAILENPQKKQLFTPLERKQMIQESVGNLSNVKIETFNGLLVHFVRRKGCRLVLRGLRAITDYEYETQLALTNRKLAPEIETIFLPTSTEYSYLNSSVVKEVARFGGCIRGLVPPVVESNLQQKFRVQLSPEKP